MRAVAGGLTMAALWLGSPLRAEEPAAPVPTAVPAAELDQRISEVIRQPEYSWREPRERVPTGDTAGFLAAFFEDVGKWLEDSMRWLGKAMRRLERWLERLLRRDDRPQEEREGLDWQNVLRVSVFLILAATASLLGIVVYRLWRGRRRPPPVAARPLPGAAQLLQEESTAAELPYEEWVRLAGNLMSQGDWRLSARALFLASLSLLAYRDVIRLARHKSNRDYLRESSRRARDRADVAAALGDSIGVIERVWYGCHAADAATVTRMQQNHERLLAALPTPGKEAA